MTVLTDILASFDAILEWFVASMGNIAEIFYAVPTGGTEAELTVYGVLGICALGVGIVMLISNKALDLFRWR